MQHLPHRTACLALVFWATGAHAEGAPLSPEQLFERLSPSVCVAETFDGANPPAAGGSAVVIGPGSLITNCHVLAKASRVAIARENVSYGATLTSPTPIATCAR